MRIKNKKRFYIMILILFVVSLIVLGIAAVMIRSAFLNNALAQANSSTVSNDSVQVNKAQVTSTSDQTEVTKPSDTMVLVNKSHSLDKNYVPSDLVWVNLRGVRETQLRQEAADALKNLFKEADSKAVTLYCCSGYRSYETQQELYQENVKTYGQKQADLVSAKPGQSEHQTGLAMDVTAESVNLDLDESFGETTEGQFVKNNAYKYGFIIRYQEDKTAITGYAYEPWHLRYVGKDAAATIFKNDITLEEYLKK